MFDVPEELLARLTVDEASGLTRALEGIAAEAAAVYAANKIDHRESRGDNAQLFGMKIWVHLRFRLGKRFDGDPIVQVVDTNGSYALRVGPLSLGVYKLGDFVDDDIYTAFPEASPTKRAYGERNRSQLKLFEYSPESAVPAGLRYGLNDLIAGHFGNPRDGLVKWYLGAFVYDEAGRPQWAWVKRQGLADGATLPSHRRPPIVPFDARDAEHLEVRPRRDVASGQSE